MNQGILILQSHSGTVLGAALVLAKDKLVGKEGELFSLQRETHGQFNQTLTYHDLDEVLSDPDDVRRWTEEMNVAYESDSVVKPTNSAEDRIYYGLAKAIELLSWMPETGQVVSEEGKVFKNLEDLLEHLEEVASSFWNGKDEVRDEPCIEMVRDLLVEQKDAYLKRMGWH